MARYFFSISYHDRNLPDREGVELPADVDLHRCALYLADKLRADIDSAAASIPDCTIRVSNTQGDVLLTLPVQAA